ncbi:polyprotein of EF-Ts, chloroplastic isoform X1 [Physcomitrium patens]|uniref:Elongation factor Ts, mitochondrial n=2 Tax=Physcomitrium patens TaxID=3218 RepID=A0A2K1JMS0_PHYPA|nr:uncharacterized protein LOC112290799 isoform X1 [Physcomitrium patens]XP_024393259.1 uncharacterized protein LOC112290799 isoform X1 [Physcomitrium patens]XP_024393260.1 uncharacterized protein LOC112290799 isoform X1 [Physcomitrium patens]PNR42842.1 hypothetical protein PHYPA_017673 [Physcomitrium patens]|eukprot:XP_024393258.1 uncharacterized protein LOC112290799 isoform X1 [Physcomitrella patens]
MLMAYVALPTRNSTVLHLANAAARLPRNACSIVQSSRSLKDILPLRPLKVHSSCLSAARILSNLTTTDWRIFSSVEDNVTVEEPAVDATAGGSGGENIPEATAAEETESSEASAKKMQRNSTMKGRAGGKTITVQKDQIVPGAVFTGRVRFVQPYGAFVDIGAFTNGLVHVSELAPGYVKDVSDFVKVGQEVTVTVLEMNEKSKRIALTMRDRESEAAVPSFRSGDELNAGSGTSGDGSGKPTNQGKIAGRGNGGSRSNLKPKLRQSKAKTKLKKGEVLKGTVKNIIRNGAFIEFPEQGEEAFLRGSEVTEGGENVPIENLLTVGQEVTVRVLKIERGKAYLTMKPQIDMTAVNDSINSGVVGGATNPFATFFRSVNMVSRTLVPVDAQETASAAHEALTVDKIASVPETSAAEEASDVQEAPVIEVISAAQKAPTEEEAPAVDATSVSEGKSAVVEFSPEVSQASVESSEESSASSEANIEESRSLSLGELAEGIGKAVGEVENVVEAAAQRVEHVVEAAADILKIGEKADESKEAALQEPEASAAEEPAEVAPQEPKAGPPEESKTAATVEPKAVASAGPTSAQVKQLREKSGAGMMDCKKALVACSNDVAKAQEYLRKKGLASAEKKAGRIAAEGRVGSYVHGGRLGVLIEINCETDFVSRGSQFKELVMDMGMQVVACPAVQYVSTDDVPADFVAKEKEIEMSKEDLANKPVQIRERIVEGRVAKRLGELALLEQPFIRDDKVPVKDLVKELTAQLGEKIQIRRFVRYNLGEGLQKKSDDFASEVAAQIAAKADLKPVTEVPKVEVAKKEEDSPKVAVSVSKVKELREMSGAGMMDCKKALAACDNDIEKATEYLRKKGLASADKKSGRIASEGLIGSYIHDGRIGVLIEVNSETDFVSRSDLFKELVANMGMQVAACSQVEYVTVEEIPASIVEKEKEIEASKEDLANKPEAIRSKIVEGRVAKTLNELALLEQPFIRDDKILVKDYIKQTIATLGENIQVRRFTRFNLGEGIEKKSTDFAAEVAAQTGAKA